MTVLKICLQLMIAILVSGLGTFSITSISTLAQSPTQSPTQALLADSITTSGSSSGGEPTTTITYQPTTSLFPNPERGFYRYFESKSSTSPQTIWSVSELTSTNSVSWMSATEEATITQLYCFFVLDDFLTIDIDAAFLQNIRDNLANVRAAGKKCILRFAYSNDGADNDGDTVYDPDVFENGNADADLPQILAHIAQLAPILDEYVDVISVLQAGFIGVWGEWYYTNHFIDEPTTPWVISATQHQRRRQVIDALLGALSADRMIAVRYPVAKKEMYNRTTPITAGEAYQNSAVARIGYHNDAFLNSFGDSGTFQEPGDQAFLAAETVYLSMGGEINSPGSGAPSRGCPNTLSEMEAYHWSYINTDYYIPALENWQNNGCIHDAGDIPNSILDRLGYRFRLVQATFPDFADSGGTAQIQINLVNEGFAAPYNPRDVALILRGSTNGTEYSFPLAVDPRTWLADGQTYQIDHSITLPADMPVGHYDLYLHLPDPNSTLAADERYAIRLANTGFWSAGSWDGYNALLHSVEIRLPPGPPTERIQQLLPLGFISQSNPNFVWQPVTNATGYRAVVYDVDNNAIVVDNIFASSAVCTFTTCTATFANFTFTPGTYLWLIQALNSYGSGPWSIYP